jgi:hypothetical protein
MEGQVNQFSRGNLGKAVDDLQCMSSAKSVHDRLMRSVPVSHLSTTWFS